MVGGAQRCLAGADACAREEEADHEALLSGDQKPASRREAVEEGSRKAREAVAAAREQFLGKVIRTRRVVGRGFEGGG